MSDQTKIESPSERSKRRRAERCVYFTGVQNERCKVGHLYAEFRKELPCIAAIDFGERPHCADCRLPTPEEIEAEDREHKEFLASMGKARASIVAFIRERGKWGQDDAGSLLCPNCGGTLRYRYAGSYNGHIHGHCETPGCASWME